MTDMSNAISELRARQDRVEAVGVAHASEISALRNIADGTRSALSEIDKRLTDLIRISERQAVQGESIGRAFGQISALSSRFDELSHRVLVIETTNKSWEANVSELTRTADRLSDKTQSLSSKVDSLSQTRDTVAAFGGPLYNAFVRTLVGLIVLALTALAGVYIGEHRNESNRSNGSPTLDARADGVRGGSSSGPELPIADGRDQGGGSIRGSQG